MYRNDETAELRNKIEILKEEKEELNAELVETKRLHSFWHKESMRLEKELFSKPKRQSFWKDFLEWKAARKKRYRNKDWDMFFFVTGGVLILAVVSIFFAVVHNSSSNFGGFVVSRDYRPPHTTVRHTDHGTQVTHHSEEYNIRVCGENGCQTIDDEEKFNDPAWSPGTFHCLHGFCSGPHDDGREN